MTISEVAKKFGMSEDALRYYEKIGIIPPVLRTSGGIRNYADDDIHWVEFAKRMRDAGVSTEALVEYVSLVFEGKKTVSRRKKILRDEREKIARRVDALNSSLEFLDYKIQNYDTVMREYENRLAENFDFFAKNT